MGDNNEQEAVDLDAMNNDGGGDDIFEVVYRGGRLFDSEWYDIPADVFIRLRIEVSVTDIDADACHGCRMLREVVFHDNVITIGQWTFAFCSSLVRIELPEGLLRLEGEAFRNCDSLREIVIPASVQFIGNDIFRCSKSLQRVVFAPTSTTVELGSGMFSKCSNLRFVTLPHNVRSIPRWCFMNCTSLTDIRIPVSVEVIEEGAFAGSAIQSIVMLENVHQIDRAAFQNCLSLKKVTFHSSNLTVTNNIFRKCPSLTVLMIAPWLWPKLFVSMNEHPEFIFNFFRQYQTQIFDFQLVNPDDEVEGEGTLHNNREDNNNE